MSLLFVVWLCALFVLLVVGLLSLFLVRRGRSSTSLVQRSFRDLFADELYGLVRRSVYLVAQLLPHARALVRRIRFAVHRVREKFVGHVFGRIAIERGRASSFFLKHIAEHQEFLRHRPRNRQRYEESM